MIPCLLFLLFVTDAVLNFQVSSPSFGFRYFVLDAFGFRVGLGLRNFTARKSLKQKLRLFLEIGYTGPQTGYVVSWIKLQWVCKSFDLATGTLSFVH